MKYIAHRGLFDGPNAKNENNPIQIGTAWFQGYDCEIDVWYDGSRWFLGHDRPNYEINNLDWINRKSAWLHCKNLPAFHKLMELHKQQQVQAHFFWHESDLVTWTNTGYVWTYFGKPETLSPYSICVMPEMTRSFYEIAAMTNCAGFCSDYVSEIKTLRTK